MRDSRLRSARVGEVLPPSLIGRARSRRIDATAVLLPGREPVEDYVAALDDRAADFAGWDGRVLVAEPDGADDHRLVIVDRYGQVYDVSEAASTTGLPDADAVTEWFRFLATACPECGVRDDPVPRAWTP